MRQYVSERAALLGGVAPFAHIDVRIAAFKRAEGVGLGPEQRKLALETALTDVSALKAA
jgi:FMN-dependent NADH-azoreductase